MVFQSWVLGLCKSLIERNFDYNSVQSEAALSDFLIEHCLPHFKVALFLCDDVWISVNRIVRYKKIWKRSEELSLFGAYTEKAEFEFFNSNKSEVMYATWFDLNPHDVPKAVKICASNTHGHSFIFLRSDKALVDVKSTFESAGLNKDAQTSIDWDSLAKFMRKNECFPVQKWTNFVEFSLKIFMDIPNQSILKI